MNPWDRQHEESRQESHQAFEAFAVYRELGVQRSTAKVAQQLGKSKALMDRWSSRWRWVDRCAAWDAHLESEHQASLIQATKEAAERQARIGENLATLAYNRLVPLLAERDAAGQFLHQLKPEALVRAIALGVEVERMARGMASVQRLEIAHVAGETVKKLAEEYGLSEDEIMQEMERIAQGAWSG